MGDVLMDESCDLLISHVTSVNESGPTGVALCLSVNES